MKRTTRKGDEGGLQTHLCLVRFYIDYINVYMQLNRLLVYSHIWTPTTTTTINDGARDEMRLESLCFSFYHTNLYLQMNRSIVVIVRPSL